MSKGVRLGGRPSRAAATKIEGTIVATARDLFFMHGYGATSIETIARAAGISKRTFYHRFENKAAVFKAVFNALVQRIKPADSESLFEGKSCEESLNHVAQALLVASLSPDALSLQRLVISEAARFPELALAMSQQGARQEAIERIAKLLKKESEAGRLEIEDPSIAAELFLQLVIGLPQRRALGLGKPMTESELKSWARSSVKIFLHGCAH